jgi:glycosyltransferase involved in cell wall biosynthesis
MKVLHVAPSIARSYGGPSQSLAGYAHAARIAGAEVTVAAPACSSEDAAVLAQFVPASSLHFFRSYGGGAFTTSPRLVRWVARSASSFDVVHVHGLLNPVSSLALRAAHQAGAPTIIRPFGTLSRYTFEHRRAALKRAYFGVLERDNLRSAAALHFTTTAERDEAEWHEIDFSARSFVVPPPFVTVPHETAIAQPDSEEGLVVFLSRLNPVKNVEALISAWPGVKARIPAARLVIAGAGDADYGTRLKDDVALLGIGGSVTFPGFVSGKEKAALLSAASVFVLPSHHENFGIAVLEALAAGVPVVVSNNVQLAPFIASNELGIITSSESNDLSDALITALSDTSLRERVRHAGPLAVEREYSPQAIGPLLMSMYAAAATTPTNLAEHHA